MDKEELGTTLAPHLKRLGFKKKGRTWHRTSEDVVEVFNIQGSSWSKDDYYLNLGIYLKALGKETLPPEYNCHIRERIPSDLRFDVPEIIGYLTEWLEQRNTFQKLKQLKSRDLLGNAVARAADELLRSDDESEDPMTADRVFLVLKICSALGCGLTAGVLFAFSSFIMNGLARLPPAQGIAAMQSINITVVNPSFFTVFFGTALICLYLAIRSLLRWGQPGASLMLAGSLLYLLGTIVVTIAFNVPLNDALAAVKPESAEGATLWAAYLARWTAWNHVRTLAALAAAASFITALIQRIPQ